MKEIYLNFHNSNIRICCDRDEFLEGAMLILNRHMKSTSKQIDFSIEFISADNFWGYNGNPSGIDALTERMEQIGRRIYVRDNDEIFVKQFVDYPGISCWYRNDMMTLIYEYDAFFHRDDVYRTVYMLTTIFPIATYLAKRKNMFFLHGGAVKFRDKNIAFLGLQGVGKSTLMLRMLREAGGKFLSDNIYFHDSSKIYACPETLRLDNKSIEFIAPPDDLLIDTNRDTDLGRKMYLVNDTRYMDNCQPDIFLIPRFSPEKSELKLAKEDIITLVFSFNELALELRAFAQWSAPFLMMDGSFLSRRIETLQMLLKDAPVYHLLIKKGDSPDKLIELIERIAIT